MSFREYIAKQIVTDTPAGDFIGDAQGDPNFPDALAWGEVASYLRRRRACEEAIEAGHGIWRDYIATR